MGFLDKAKAAAEQAATRAKEGVDDVQTKRELSQAYSELGKTAYELVEAGEVANPRLTAAAEKIRGLIAKVEGSTGNGATAPAAEEPDASQPHA
jgi:hypothetical protein